MASSVARRRYNDVMNRRLSLLIVPLLLNAAAGAAQPHPALPAATVPEGLGVNIHFTDPRPGEMEMLADAGFRWVRMDFSWAATERERDHYDFAAYDRLLTALDQHKLRALFILDYGNPLYETGGEVRTEAGRTAFARWAAAAARHFAGHGILWEIWNEPNGGFWKPHANVEEYTALALATSHAIRTAAPREAIIGPATSGVDLPFLEACFRAGLLQWWDAVSVHPYRQSAPESATADYHRLRQLIQHYAPAGKAIPILSGEWGYSAAWAHFGADQQGKMLPRQWLNNLAQHIPLSIWYDWHDDGTNPHDPEHHFGTVRFPYRANPAPVYEPKPAYLAAQTLTQVLRGYEFKRRLALGNPDDFALLFAQGDALRLAVWTTSATSHPVTLPATNGSFTRVQHTGAKAPALAATNGFLQFTIADAPQYLIADGPNSALAAAPAARALRAYLAPVDADWLAVQIEKLDDAPFAGLVRLLVGPAGDPAGASQPVVFKADDAEKHLAFRVHANSAGEITAGARLEDAGVTLFEQPVRRFRFSPETLLTGSRIVPDGDAQVASQPTLAVTNAPQPLDGRTPATWRITYACDDGWKFFRVVPTGETGRVIPGEPRAFGFWICGDGGGASPRLRVVDVAGQTWQATGDTIHWQGWRHVEMALTPAAAHWGGANDGRIHFPVRWDSVFLLDNISRHKTAGEIYVTAPVVIY